MSFEQATNERYDQRMFAPQIAALYDGSDFHNVGLWSPATKSLRQACEGLLDRLLGFIPEKRGTILDVACGKGATTRHLLKHYPARSVTAINISKKQLETGRKNAPGCAFMLMDAVRLGFPAESFDNILCVEAAQDFNTRESFLYEAYRVLKPGGRLVFSDILLEGWAEDRYPARRGANFLRDPEDHRALVRRVGFREAESIDATADCSVAYTRYLTGYLGQQLAEGAIDRKTFNSVMAYLSVTIYAARYYVIAWALKR